MVGLGAIHAVKFTMARARPIAVLGEKQLPFTPWYWPNIQFTPGGLYRDSFPSGHAAAICLLMAAAYLLAGDPLLARMWRLTGWAVGTLTVILSLAMGLASSMSASHWLSDSIVSVGLVWFLTHALYHRILKVPEQRLRWKKNGVIPILPGRWELRACTFGIFAAFSIAALGAALRAWPTLSAPTFTILIVLAFVTAFVAISKFVALLTQFNFAMVTDRPFEAPFKQGPTVPK
jgi:hypothetical protein